MRSLAIAVLSPLGGYVSDWTVRHWGLRFSTLAPIIILH